MHRLIALIIMLVVPLQFAWAGAVGIDGHAGKTAPTTCLHAHDDGHGGHGAHGAHGDAQHDHDVPDGSSHPEHTDDGHHCHVHPVFFSLLAGPGLTFAEAIAGGPMLQPPSSFLSHTPPLLDRPPLAHA